METKDIADILVEVFGLANLDLCKYNTDSVDLLHALIELESIAKVSEYLDISENALEHVLHRKLRKYFPEKDKAEKWSCHLLRMLDLRKCPKCKRIKCFDQFHVDKSRFTGYSIYCANCSSAKSFEYREQNPHRVSEYRKEHYLANIGYYKDKAAHRRALIIKATPEWADRSKILDIYQNCPENHHVDHIVPLNSDVVCGLHVEHNLQYLTAEDNLRKSNKFIPG